jgi:hypothetical protein
MQQHKDVKGTTQIIALPTSPRLSLTVDRNTKA